MIFKCTRPNVYSRGSRAFYDVSRREAFYVEAPTVECAREVMHSKFPRDSEFTADPVGHQLPEGTALLARWMSGYKVTSWRSAEAWSSPARRRGPKSWGEKFSAGVKS